MLNFDSAEEFLASMNSDYGELVRRLYQYQLTILQDGLPPLTEDECKRFLKICKTDIHDSDLTICYNFNRIYCRMRQAEASEDKGAKEKKPKTKRKSSAAGSSLTPRAQPRLSESQLSLPYAPAPGIAVSNKFESLADLEPVQKISSCSSEPAPAVCSSNRKRRAASSLSMSSSASQTSWEDLDTPPASERATTPVPDPDEEVEQREPEPPSQPCFVQDEAPNKPANEDAPMEYCSEGCEYSEESEKAPSRKAPVRSECFVRVIRGLPLSAESSNVKQDLEDQGIQILSCFRMKSRRFKGLLPLFQVVIWGSPSCVVGITRILGERATFEEKRRVDVVLCYRCCRFGHVAKDCTERLQRCMRCGGDHRLSECSQPRSTSDVRCINCNSPGHLAAWRACPEHPRHRNNRSVPATRPRPPRTLENPPPARDRKPRPQAPQALDSRTRSAKPRPAVTQSQPRLQAELAAMQDFFAEVRKAFKDVGGFASILSQFSKLQSRSDKLSFLLALAQD